MTQVVHVAEGHIFHNRLVHSLKVAQIGRSLVDVLIDRANKAESGIVEAVGGVDVDVVETACLAHDLGHPPFGHIAEQELDKLATKHKVRDGFEGNAQSFRIVSRVAIHDRRYPGLNLTSASLNAILKYPWKRGPKKEKKKYKKWGYYNSDQESFDHARQRDGKSDKRSVEAEIMDWADDVTYSIHDLEDFYRAGIVPLDRILIGGTELTQFLNSIEAENGSGDSEELCNPIEVAEGIFKELRDGLPRELLVPFQGTTAQYRALRLFETLLIKRFLALSKDEELHLDSVGESRLKKNDRLKTEVDILKSLMRFYVYDAPALLSQQYGQRKVIRGIFDILLEAANDTKKANILPAPFNERLREIDEQPKTQRSSERVRLVMDAIASMTEQQAVTYYARLSGTSLGFLADRIFGA